VHRPENHDVGELVFQGLVIGKDAESGGLLHRRHFNRTRRDRQVRRNVRGNAEAMSVVDDGLDAKAVGQFQRRDVAGLGQRAPQRNGGFQTFRRNCGTRRGLTGSGRSPERRGWCHPGQRRVQ